MRTNRRPDRSDAMTRAVIITGDEMSRHGAGDAGAAAAQRRLPPITGHWVTRADIRHTAIR